MLALVVCVHKRCIFRCFSFYSDVLYLSFVLDICVFYCMQFSRYKSLIKSVFVSAGRSALRASLTDMLRISSVCAIHPAAYEQARRILLYVPDPSCAETLSTGDGGIRTLDPLLARQVLSQLSYTPAWAYYFYHFSCFLSSVFSFFILAATYSPIPSPV